MKRILVLITALCAASPVLAQPVYGDRVTQYAAVEAEQWVNCAKEGKDCAPGTNDLVIVRYGISEDFTFFVTKGVEKVPCKNFWGDPSKGTDKECAFILENLFGVPEAESFSKVADEGKDFTNPNGEFRWVRYGADGKWIYTLIEGSDRQKLACTNSYFGFDPAKGTDKTCQMGGAYTLNDGDIVECATEGRDCQMNVGDVVMARYGADKRYDIRFIHHTGNTYPCDNTFFGVDPIHSNKRCYYQAQTPVSVNTVGRWQKVISCDGLNCPISHQISVGTERTNSWTTTQQWSVTVTESMEAGLTILGTGIKASASVAVGYAGSFAYTSALSKSVTQNYTATCDPSGIYTTRALWQFSTGTGTSCLEAGTCDGATFTAEYLCVGDAPSGYKGPACIPGYCADELCTYCTYEDASDQ
ncbi:hypothetical protein [Antarctobacter sp.]|uniref:hypothetical protein n=1 Tax=Antarctobacter sp. TaxID=1872577 RepID=UPI003A917B36